MEIVERGKLTSGVAGTTRATFTFPSVVALSDGGLLASCRVGSKKDSADETVEFYRSGDEGHTWSEGQRPFTDTQVGGVQGSIRVCYVTELEKGHIIAACMWVDRQTHQEKPLFNNETEGCLPMAVLLSDSYDDGNTWTPLRVISLPEDIGPPSLTGPILKLEGGKLAMSIETNKHYQDSTKWYQRVVMFYSMDAGKTWKNPITVSEDVSGQIFYWDLRVGVVPDGRIVAFSWTYDSKANRYLNIQRRISVDGGQTWGLQEDLGFADQPAHPAILPDGRVVLAWVDRFGHHSIRARIASAVDRPFKTNTELVIHTQEIAASTSENTGELLQNMNLRWSFGLPYGEVLPDGEVIVMYYAGTERAMDIHWVRLHLET